MKSQQQMDASQATVQAREIFSTRAWLNFLKAIAPVAMIACLYFSSSRALISYWNDFSNLTYTHGWVVLLVMLWLMFDALLPLDKVRLHYSRWGAVGLFLSSIVWLLAHQTNIQIIQFLLLPAMGWLALLSIYGFAVAKRCAFALAYLYFAIPWWGELNSLLQWGTVFAERAAVRIVGIPAYFDANTIHLPSGVIAVEGGCSGLHFFIVGLALAALYWYVNRVAHKWRLLMLAAALAIFANWVRVFVILVAGHLTNMQHYLVRVEHYRFGWGVFALMMVIFFLIAHRMPQSPPLSRPNDESNESSRVMSYAQLAGLALALLLVPVYARSLDERAIPISSSIDIPAPAGWQQNSTLGQQWRPIFMRADAEVLKSFDKSSLSFDVYRAVYSTQTQQKKIAADGNTPIGELRDVQIVATEKTGNGFVQSELSDAIGNRQLIWYAYYVDGQWFGSALRAQMWSGIKAIVSHPRTGVVALHTSCAQDCRLAKQAFAEWTSADQLRQFSRK